MIASAQIDLESLIEVELPPLPGVAMRVAALTQDLDASTRKIADAIGCDPALAARVLRAANSPLFCFQRDITALPTAVSALGNENLYSLVFMSAAAEAFTKSGRTQFEQKLWHHSVAVGVAAREIMLMLRLRGLEEGFLCGLLHDIGKLMLLRHDPIVYKGLLACEETELLRSEASIYGYTHAQVGALAAKRWNLPDEVCHTIFYHHDPGQSINGILMARVVDFADAIAYHAGFGIQLEERNLVESESALSLRLTEEQIQQIIEKTRIGSGEAMSMLM
ncbi:MAG TPA: HDOD domain-containing protein [Pyrinomonadaceae bacterium]